MRRTWIVVVAAAFALTFGGMGCGGDEATGEMGDMGSGGEMTPEMPEAPEAPDVPEAAPDPMEESTAGTSGGIPDEEPQRR